MNPTAADTLRAAAAELAEARIAYARAFALAKVGTSGMPVSDKTAEYAATEMTQDSRTVAQANYEIALAALKEQS